MILFKLTESENQEDISKPVVKTAEGYWRNYGKPVRYASSTYDLAALEYYNNTIRFQNTSNLMMSCFEIPPNVLTTRLDESILPEVTAGYIRYFFTQSVIDNWRHNSRTVLIKLPAPIVNGKDILLNPMHKDFNSIKMIWARKFVAAKKKNIAVMHLEKPDKNTRRKQKRFIKYEIDIFMWYAAEQKQQVIDALLKEINRFGLRYLLDNEFAHHLHHIGKRVKEGLSQARYVLVIINENLLERPSAISELQKVLLIQMQGGAKGLIPVIAGTKGQRERILQQLPLLKDFPHFEWTNNARAIIRLILKDLHK